MLTDASTLQQLPAGSAAVQSLARFLRLRPTQRHPQGDAIKRHPGVRSARAWIGATLEALHFQRLIATENAGPSLALTENAINQIRA
jgi:hypothetical protein